MEYKVTTHDFEHFIADWLNNEHQDYATCVKATKLFEKYLDERNTAEKKEDDFVSQRGYEKTKWFTDKLKVYDTFFNPESMLYELPNRTVTSSELFTDLENKWQHERSKQ